MSMRFDTILILDFGGQYCHLIGRRIREHEVYSEIVSYDTTPDQIKALGERLNVKGIILSGGPSSIYEENAPKCNPDIFDLGIPILGLCYGHQLISFLFGGRVEPAKKREYGISHAIVDSPHGLLKDLNGNQKVWMSHGDTVCELPEEFEILAHTGNCPVAAFGHREQSIYGLQWHPEVFHTENGTRMLKNFLFEVCGCQTNWIMEDFVAKAVDEMRQIVGTEKCVIGLSGGIDSSTATILASKAIGKNLTAVFVDHGFMRGGESDFVQDSFKGFDMSLFTVNAKRRFRKRLKGILDPEQKRRLIGEEFIRVFENVARKVGANYLIQGTVYPDRIESGFRKHSEKIKTHHNVAGLPARIEFKGIIEPLRDLYKDEVRKVAEKLGLSEKLVRRQPFPGPGLAVRIIGEATQEKADVVRRADRIVREEIEASGLNNGLWQYFAVLTDSKSTGIKGDARAYGYTIAVRALESKEAMTAVFARIPYEILEKISTRITNEIPEITRVVYDITHKPPATIEWE
ncbi:MAG: glutamine-hydrolyzing GMP synthase [Candidatus Bathyarchaeota archaeon]|nr:MAG: glutamine-hydrolyzing GMP synthase [Candidatus Bathyarchaeota archaeon]